MMFIAGVLVGKLFRLTHAILQFVSAGTFLLRRQMPKVHILIVVIIIITLGSTPV